MLNKLLITFFSFVFVIAVSFAEDNSWTIIPKTDSTEVLEITEWKSLLEEYRKFAKEKVDANKDIWLAFKTWVFSWDTIFEYLKYLAKLLSQIWLVVGAAMIIYAGYKYATWVFTQDVAKWWRDAIKSAIFWLLIVIFSYAIIKLLLNMFW